jgi:DNA modification methylase
MSNKQFQTGLSPTSDSGITERQIALQAISDLKPHAHNARKHSRAQIAAIAKSIDAFGFNAPVLVDGDQNVLAGHGRLEAARLLGMKEVPVVHLHHLTETQARAYMLADNKLTDRSTWDDETLAVQLKELSELIPDFDIEATGFEAPEIDFRIQSLEDAETIDRADNFELAVGPSISVNGELWHLDNHRIFCGSALDPNVYLQLLVGEKATASFTDPPYNVKVDGHVSGRGRIHHREFPMATGEMSKGQFTAFLESALALIRQHSKPGALIYGCMDWRHMSEMLHASTSAGCELLNLCVWVKTNGGMGSLYRSRHELIFVFRNGPEPHQNNIQLGRFGRNRTNVWNYTGSNNFARKGSSRSLELHPTVKPVLMVADAIQDSTNRNDVVLDPFLGSGTTLLAAERTGRRCYGVELDPLYVDTAIERWQRMTGHKAHNPLGESFEIVKSRRLADR